MRRTLMILVFFIAGIVLCNALPVTIYVSPEGNDEANNGTFEAPFASFQRAALAVKGIRKTAKDTIFVYFRGGEYEVNETITLFRENGGRHNTVVVYASYPGEEAVFTGGRAIKGWRRVRDNAVLSKVAKDVRKYLVEADITGIDMGDPITDGKRPLLYLNGKEQTLARWPQEGFTYGGKALGKTIIPVVENGNSGAVEGIFEYKDDRIDKWAAEKDPKVGGYWFWDWDDAYYSVTGIDTGRKVMTVSRDKYFRHGLRFFGLNLLCELDTPGEWYLDRKRGRIYWCPPEGMNPVKEDAGISISVFEGKYMMRLNDCRNTVIDGITFTQTRGNAIRISSGENCVLRNCRIENIGNSGVDVNEGTGHRIEGCAIRHLGGSGIYLEGGSRKDLVAAGFEVNDNVIEDFARFHRTYRPAVGCDGCGIHVHHNLVRNAPSSAFSLGGNDIVAEFNVIEDVAKESDDQGAYDLYLNPSMRGIQLRYNYWKNIVGGTRYGVGGIRLDDLITGIRIYGNVFDNCGSVEFGAIQIHGGSENVIEDNLFYKCKYAVSFTQYGEEKWKETYDSIHKMLYEDVDMVSDRYLLKYPEIREFGKNIDQNVIRNNMVYGCGDVFFHDGGIQITGNNTVCVDDGRSVEQMCLKETLNPCGIQTIPVSEMGVRHNRWIGK